MKTSNSTRFASACVVAVLGAASAPMAVAQSTSGAQGLLDNPWVFNLGAFVLGSDVKASLNGQSSSNPEVDFDDSFGKSNDATRVRADALWRITPAHRMRFMYFDNTVSRGRELTQDLHWGDYTLNAGTRADFRQNLTAIALAYEYAFMRRPTYEVAASLGIHYLDLKMQLSGSGTVNKPDGTSESFSGKTEEKSLPAPLPMVGLRGGWVVSPDWYIDAQGQFFKFDIGDYDGYWSDIRVGATWMFHKNFGLGLGYNRFVTNVDVTRNDFNGKLKFGYGGLQAYLTGTF